MLEFFNFICIIFRLFIIGINEPMPRWELCINLVKKIMGFAVDVLLEKKNPVTTRSKDKIEEIFYSIRDIVGSKLKKFSTIPNLERYLNRKVISINY